MPKFHFICPECHAFSRKIMTVEQAEEEVLCPNGHVTQREASGGSVQVREILDNGFQPKPVDRLSEGPRLYQEHLKDHKTEK